MVDIMVKGTIDDIIKLFTSFIEYQNERETKERGTTGTKETELKTIIKEIKEKCIDDDNDVVIEDDVLIEDDVTEDMKVLNIAKVPKETISESNAIQKKSQQKANNMRTKKNKTGSSFLVANLRKMSRYELLQSRKGINPIKDSQPSGMPPGLHNTPPLRENKCAPFRVKLRTGDQWMIADSSPEIKRVTCGASYYQIT